MKWLFGSLLLVFCLPWGVFAAELPPWEFGLRGGLDARGVDESFIAGEGYLMRALPWRTDLGGGTLTARVDLGVGSLEAANDHGGWLAAGGDLVWLPGESPFAVEVGFRPAWLCDHHYGKEDFGGSMQFASHAGIALRFSRLVVSYRYQHLSNAGIYDRNGGLDLHLFGVGAGF
jgi:hypothetical protein